MSDQAAADDATSSRTSVGSSDAATAERAAAELQELLLSSEGFDEFLQYLAGYVAAAVGPELWCGVTIYRDNQLFSMASSDPAALRVDEAQHRSDDGPCLHSMRTGEEVLIADLTTEQRWPSFHSAASEPGVQSSMSFPLGSRDGGVVGALNLYASSTHAFSPDGRSRARHLAQDASRVLALAIRLVRHVEFTDQLQAALTSRAVIDQALGIIVAQNRCDADQAFAILRSASQNRNLKLHVIAAEIVTAASGKPPRPGRHLNPPGHPD